MNDRARDLTKWREWLKRIDGEITTVWLSREVWKSVVTLLENNLAIPPSHFFDQMSGWYAQSQAIAVRRQAETRLRWNVVSMGALLEDMKNHAAVLTRTWFLSQYGAELRHLAERDFEGIAGGGQEYIPTHVMDTDLQRLAAATAPIKKYVDKQVAHSDPLPRRDLPTFEDLDSAIDLLGELLQKYVLILQAVNRNPIAPVPQYDWLAPFRVPWIASDSDARGSLARK